MKTIGWRDTLFSDKPIYYCIIRWDFDGANHQGIHFAGPWVSRSCCVQGRRDSLRQTPAERFMEHLTSHGRARNGAEEYWKGWSGCILSSHSFRRDFMILQIDHDRYSFHAIKKLKHLDLQNIFNLHRCITRTTQSPVWWLSFTQIFQQASGLFYQPPNPGPTQI